ncbi:MAG: SDR family oxidoreductase [Chitinophagaceae bacterium]
MKKTKVLIIGAGGAIARHVIDMLIEDKDISLTLFLRNAGQLKAAAGLRAHLIEGDVLNNEQLNDAVKGQDIVYANLSGSVDKMARQIVTAMDANYIKRLVFVTSLGIYDEVPGAFGKWNNRMIGASLKTYRKAADIIEASGLDYTVVRPAWLTDYDEVDYELTQKNDPFKGTEVSRKSVAAYIADLIRNPQKDNKASVGINKPGTTGDKPAFY